MGRGVPPEGTWGCRDLDAAGRGLACAGTVPGDKQCQGRARCEQGTQTMKAASLAELSNHICSRNDTVFSDVAPGPSASGMDGKVSKRTQHSTFESVVLMPFPSLTNKNEGYKQENQMPGMSFYSHGL